MRGPASRQKPHSVMRPARIPGANRRPLQMLTIGAGIVCLGVSLALGALGCQSRRHAVSRGAPHPRQELVAEIKDFEKQLGFQETNNFSRHSIDIGRPSRAFPVTPPGIRVRTTAVRRI